MATKTFGATVGVAKSQGGVTADQSGAAGHATITYDTTLVNTRAKLKALLDACYQSAVENGLAA